MDETCTHLVMPSIKVTAKVVLALCRMQPLVTPAYLEALLALPLGSPLPPASAFLPPVTDKKVRAGMSFSDDPRRRALLQGITVLCFSHAQVTNFKSFQEKRVKRCVFIIVTMKTHSFHLFF